MKNKRKILRNKYKFQGGVQRIQEDTTPYDSAYAIREQENAKNQIGQNIGAAAANIAMPGLGSAMQGVGAISDAVFKDAKGNYKNDVSKLLGSQLNPLDKAGKSLNAVTGFLSGNFKNNTAAADLYDSSFGGTLLKKIGVKKNPFGQTTQDKVKEEAQKSEEATKMANVNKRYTETAATDVQAALAKRGKYKVKSKQPRLIETEGREPIFSPPDKNGKRKLLYYNPNDPTHEEGGVKAVVVPRAQGGKQKLKTKPAEEPYVPLEDNDSISEEIVEILDPTGMSSYDDVYRSAHNFLSKKNRNIDDYVDLGLQTLGAIPVMGKAGKLVKLGKTALKYADKGLDAYKIAQRARQIKRASEAARVPTGNFVSRTLKRVLPTRKGLADFIGDVTTGVYLGKEFSGYRNPEWDRTHSLQNAEFVGRRIFPNLSSEKMYAYGAKQVKVNDLNNAALSQNFAGMPAVNAANKFVQPMAGKMQVARQIPEYRRKATIKNPMSHKKENPDTNRIIDPPVPYELKPKPEKSHSKKVKVYR